MNIIKICFTLYTIYTRYIRYIRYTPYISYIPKNFKLRVWLLPFNLSAGLELFFCHFGLEVLYTFHIDFIRKKDLMLQFDDDVQLII
jgi:hypothetical protein